MPSNSTSFVSQVVLFSIKASIALVFFVVAMVVVMPDFTVLPHLARKAAKDEKTRVALMSFIQNPAALYRASEIDEKDGNLKDAILEMEMAIGLLEMHNANQLVIKRYTARLEYLRSQLRSVGEQSPDPSPASGRFNGEMVKRWKE